MSRNFHFVTNCVGCGDGRAIRDMVDHDRQRDISRRTFLRHVDPEEMRQIEESLGYVVHGKGLHMASDYHVRYSRSFFRGRPCYYFTWSCIEYIFQEDRHEDPAKVRQHVAAATHESNPGRTVQDARRQVLASDLAGDWRAATHCGHETPVCG